MSIQSIEATKMIINKRILPRMKEKSISINKLSKMSGVSTGFLSDWLAGKNDISLNRFITLLKALEINPFFVPKELTSEDDFNRVFFN